MRRIADRYSTVGDADYDDFEKIVGAFGGESRTLQDLSELAKLVEPEDQELQAAIRTASNFAEQVRDAGISHVLEVIFEQARAHADLTEELRAFTNVIVNGFDGTVTFGNLNYDTLLLSALLSTCQAQLADMANGGHKGTIVTGDGENKETHFFPSLRTRLDFPPSKRVRLLALHGSLTYWREPDGTILKLDTEFLDTHDLWKWVRARSSKLRPVVVLANQRDKSGIIAEHPFALAYEALGQSLASSSHWLIVGYSFRDDCVNDLLRKEFERWGPKPRVLIVTKGLALTRDRVEQALGWNTAQGKSDPWLSITRRGASQMGHTHQWEHFTQASEE